jgi:hypothetical protein
VCVDAINFFTVGVSHSVIAGQLSVGTYPHVNLRCPARATILTIFRLVVPRTRESSIEDHTLPLADPYRVTSPLRQSADGFARSMNVRPNSDADQSEREGDLGCRRNSQLLRPLPSRNVEPHRSLQPGSLSRVAPIWSRLPVRCSKTMLSGARSIRVQRCIGRSCDAEPNGSGVFATHQHDFPVNSRSYFASIGQTRSFPRER